MNRYWQMLQLGSISSCRRHHWKRCRETWRRSCPVQMVQICSPLWGCLRLPLCPGALQIQSFTSRTSWSSSCAPSSSVTGEQCHGIHVRMWSSDTFSVFSHTKMIYLFFSCLFIIIVQRHQCLSSSCPQQCVSGPCTSGSGEKGLLFVPALSPVFPRHPRSRHLRLSKGLYQVTIGACDVHILSLAVCNAVLLCLGGAVCQMLKQKK